MNADSSPPPPDEVASRVAGHSFSPVDNGFTVEPAVAEQFATLDESSFGRAHVGDPAPDFTLKDTDGNDWSLSNARGEAPWSSSGFLPTGARSATASFMD